LRSRRGGFVRRERGRARYEWRSAVGARIRSCASRASVRPLGSEAAYISLSMARSPNAWGMTLVRRRSSPNSCSSRLVVRIACRCASGKRRCVMHASKSSCKHASAAARQWHKSCRPANAGERRRNGLVAGKGARLELQPLAFCCVSVTPQLKTRIVSVARIRLEPRKSARPFKGIIRDDISEFESSHPSHAVGLHSYHVKSARLTRGRSVAIGVHATPSSHDGLLNPSAATVTVWRCP
jgi:hypothetical protein